MAETFSAHVLALALVAAVLAPSAAAAANWGDFKRDACVAPGKRQYSSRLWNIQGDWVRACRATGASVAGQRFNRPSRCRNLGAGGMWGEFDVNDASCKARWGEFKRDACVRTGVRQYSSRLWDIPGKDSVRACRGASATIAGRSMLPARCNDLGVGGMWGEFDVPDASCPFWGNELGKPGVARAECSAVNLRKYYARLWDVPGSVDWMQACRNEGQNVAGYATPRPSSCISKGPLGMWGEWLVRDTSCTADKLPQDARRHQIATAKMAELGHVIASKMGFARRVSTDRTVLVSLKDGGEQRIARSVNLTDAEAGEQPDGYLLRTLTVGTTVGTKILIFGAQAEAGAAIDLKARRPVYAYAAGGYEWGAGLAAGGGVNVGFWVCQNNKIGGDIWGVQFGVDDLVALAMKKPSLEKGPSFAIGLWFNYDDEFQGFTLTPGFAIGADFISVVVYASTAVDGDDTVRCDGQTK
jgi:hypothetical protein